MRNLLSQLPMELVTFILTLPLFSAKGAYAITPVAAPSPDLNLNSLGRVAIAGDFDSISLFQYEGQNENLLTANGTQSLLTQYPDGTFQMLASSDAYIGSMCQFVRNGKNEGVVVGGNFTSLGGVEAQSVALWDPTSNKVTPLPGINGMVSALYCDKESGTVYVGGSFSASHSQNAMSWTTGWEDLPFAGFNGPVYSITKDSAGNIVFGGEFGGLGNTTTTVSASTQVVNLGGGNITAEGTTTTNAGFEDPSNIICETGSDGPGNTWLLSDNRGGYWEGSYGFGFVPTKLRLYNTKYQGRGTKSFAFENLANGGYLEFNWTDTNGNVQLCAGSCPLREGTTEAQDFYFTQPVGCNNFRIWINDWYGDGAGFSGIEMFQDDIYSYAINNYNEPTCDSVSNASTSIVSPATGLWNEVNSNGTTVSNYLSAYLTNSTQQTSGVSVVFNPNIPQSGNYSITVYTPGCVADGTCATRGLANLTGSMTAGEAPVTATIDQTNYFDKYDEIYLGYVDVKLGGFKPSVTLAPIAGQPLPQTIVAQRVRFDLVTTTGGLNGLYEYNPNKATVSSSSFKNSVIDTAGTQLGANAIVTSVISDADTLYVGGSFTGNGISNIMSITTDKKSLPNGGLNSGVQTMFLSGSTLYVGGNFTDTVDGSVTGLTNVAAFDISSDKWIALGAGVSGSVSNILSMPLNVTVGNEETCIAINGDFTSVNAYDGSATFPADGLAIWVPSKSNWLDNIADAAVSVTGRLMSSTAVTGQDFPLYGGQAQAEALGLSGAAELVGSGSPSLQTLGIKITDSGSSTSMMKRSLDTTENYGGVYAGIFSDQNGLNLTVLGGHFEATDSNGDTFQNLVIAKSSSTGSSQSLSGVSELHHNSTVMALAYSDNFLFTGGSITGTVDGASINGFMIYNFQTGKLISPQPPALAGSSVVVRAIAPQVDTSYVYVGGDFSHAGGLSCATLCIYDTSRKQWNPPGLGLSGVITSMFWSSKSMLVIAGDLQINGKKTAMATYDSTSKKQMFTVFPGAAALPGNITTLTPANSDYSQFWAAGIATNNGSAYLSLYANSKWTPISGFGKDTTIRGLQVLTLSSSHGSTSSMPSDDDLLVLGNIEIPNFGNASAALFNGTAFQPFLLTNKDTAQGSVAQIFVSNPQNFLTNSNNHLAVGFVVLIGLAIALALIFLLVVVGILIERHRRRREGYVPMNEKRSDRNLSRIPPETLFGRLEEKGSTPKL